MIFECNLPNMTADIAEVIRAFCPHFEESEVEGKTSLKIEIHPDNSADILLKYYLLSEEPKYCFEKHVNSEVFSDPMERKRVIKRSAKVMVYDLMEKVFEKTLPYGSLTGVRPTKLYSDTLQKGENAFDYFVNTLRVSPSKAELIKSVCLAQSNLKRKRRDSADLFVNIPFCTSRCSYCSFISAEIGRVKKFIPAYVDLLIKEIECAKAIIREGGYFLRAIYVGGGTPTSLPARDFEKVLRALSGMGVEFTVEAGRADSIDDDKLKIMDEMGVTRISVNPQSLNDKTMEIIGRKHTAAQFYSAFERARKFPFDINCDLIAGLPGEDENDFARTADGVFALGAENVTVHTLSLKKGSVLKVSGYEGEERAVGQMVDYARLLAKRLGYIPYYMYRQKYMSGNLENVGYCKTGKQCLYNIDIMEECASIVACGAGGISKLYIPEENRLERLPDPKGLDVYLSRGEELMTAKREFFLTGVALAEKCGKKG